MYQDQQEKHVAPGRHSQEVHGEEQGRSIKQDQWHEEVSGTPWLSLILWGILLTVFSLANPLLTNLATDLQSQHLYATWAMNQGQAAYASFFGTGGLLFYGLLWLSGLIPFGLVWVLVQFFALLAAGAQAYRLSYRLTGHESLSRFTATALYLLVLVLGFGGLYATIFSLPFLLHGLNRLVAYLVGQQEIGFVRYGMVAALAFMISPSAATIFYGVACFALLVGNIRRRQLGLGVYQFLASLVGFSLLFYPIGYIAVWNGSFGNAVGQVIFDLTNLQLWHDSLFWNLGVYLVSALGFGLITMFFSALTSLHKGYAELKLMGLLGLLVTFLIAIFTPDFGAYNLLAGLPFALLLLIFWLSQRMGLGVAEDSRRARHALSPASKYLMATFYLPVFVAAYLLASPVVETYILHGGETGERAQIARYIRDNSDQNARIYAWDETASLYQSSQRLSTSPILSPTLYLTNRENQIALQNGLQNAPAYIVVNNRLPLQADVQKLLEDNYQESSQRFSYFTLYQPK